MTDVAYVTQEMWDQAQKALRNVLSLVEANVPPLSMTGTAIALRDEVRAAIYPTVPNPSCVKP